jgi:acetate kinase
MKVLFDPAPPYLCCCVFRNGSPSMHLVRLQEGWADTILKQLGADAAVEAAGYVLHNGGNQVKDAVSLLSPQALQRVKRCVRLSPEYNSMTLALAEYGMKQWPGARHLLLSDTAFFTRLSPVVRNYAIPYELTRKGLGRYGAFGLCHEWIWNQTQAQTSDTAKKVISIFLGDHTSLAAIRNGIPKETTTGLTALEGIMSSGGCGDIDPTIIFLLKAAGLSYSAINRILCNESGFAALAGRPCTLGDIVSGAAVPALAEAKRLLRYQIIKQIGAMLSQLGGVDAISFASEKPQDMMPLVLEICAAFAFLGVRCRADSTCGSFPQELSAAGSAVRIFTHQYDRWSVLKAAMESFGSSNQEKKT